MNALGRFSIRTRLYFATTFSLVLLVIIGGMGFMALDRTRGTLETLFSQRVQTLTDMSDLRTSLGDLRRAEKDIIINFNNTVEVAALRESWGKTLAALRKSLADVRQVQAGDPAFVAAITRSSYTRPALFRSSTRSSAPRSTAPAAAPMPTGSKRTWRPPTNCSPSWPQPPVRKCRRRARAWTPLPPPCPA